MASITRVAPVSIFLREDLWWLAASGNEGPPPNLSSPAQQVLELLQSRGALFATDLLAESGLLPAQLDDVLGELVSIGTLLAFVIVSAGIWVLRYRSPELNRPFRTPMVPLVPILSIVICGLMMYWLPRDTWLRLIIWMAIGFLIYFLYGKNHSKLSRGQ